MDKLCPESGLTQIQCAFPVHCLIASGHGKIVQLSNRRRVTYLLFLFDIYVWIPFWDILKMFVYFFIRYKLFLHSQVLGYPAKKQSIVFFNNQSIYQISLGSMKRLKA